MNERSVFLAALEIADPAQRAAYLDATCGDDAAARRSVEELLAAHDQPGTFMTGPAAGEPTSDGTAAEAAGSRVGPYKLLQQLGEGGMGAVYMAEQEVPIRRMVALKIIREGMDSKAVLARFEAERQALAMMDHPHIAKVLDTGTTLSGRPFFVMELVKGIPITTFCDEHQLTLRERLELFVPVCQAIQHAHQKGIIHRDIKPSNVLVAMYDDKPVPKVIDFGVAKATSQKLTEKTLFTAFGSVVGTLEYMSPEQAKLNQLDIDTRSDVYGLGVLLYELLTGTTPLDCSRLKAAAFDEMLRMIREEEPERPSTRLSTVNTRAQIAAARRIEPAQLGRVVRGELDWIVMKALEKDRTRRYETANGLARDIQRYLADESVEACPPTYAYRMRKAYRKNRAAMTVVATFLVMLAAAAAVSTMLAIQARRSERLAFAERARAEQGEREAIEQRQRAEQEQRRAEQERERAEQERERAERENRTARAVRDFLHKDLLAQASLLNQAEAQRLTGGDFAVKSNPTVNELLDRAAAQLAPDKIERKFPDLPLVQAEVLMTVGDAYLEIGQDQPALELLQRAVDMYRAAGAFADPAALEARERLAVAHVIHGNTSQAEELVETVVADKMRVLGPYEPATLQAQTLLGQIYAKNHPQKAVEYMTRVREAAHTHLGQEHKATLMATGTLSVALRLAGQTQEATREIEALLETGKRLQFRPDHPALQSGIVLLALTYVDANRKADAMEVLDAALGTWEKLGDPLNPATWPYRHHLTCWKYVSAGQSEAAVPHFERNLMAAVAPWQVMLTRGELYNAYMALGRFDEALAQVQISLDELRKTFGPKYRGWHMGKTRARIGLALAAQGRYDEAEPPLVAGYDEMFAHRDQMPFYDQSRLAEAEKGILDLYQATQRPDATRALTARKLPALEEDLKRLQSRKSADSAEAFRAAATLAQAYIDAGRTAAAFKLFEQTLVRCQEIGWPLDQPSLRALSALRLVVRRADRFDLAIAMTTEIVAALRKEPDADPNLFHRELMALGLELCLSHRPAEAEPPLREVLEFWQGRHPDSWDATKAKRWLGRSLLRQEKYKDAERILLESDHEIVSRLDMAPAHEKDYFHASAGDLVELYTALDSSEELANWKAEFAKRKQAATNTRASNR